MCNWYNSEDKRAIIMNKWQSITLTQTMTESPEETEVSIFRKFVATLTTLQKQLEVTYHADRFLRDRLLKAVDIASIQTTLRDRMPETSHDAVNRIANQLSDKKKNPPR